MSAQSSFVVTNDSGFSGTDTKNQEKKSSSEDNIIRLDGVTLQGFDPGSVQVTRTTTTRVTKTTRSRSPSPAGSRRYSTEEGLPGSPVYGCPGSPVYSLRSPDSPVSSRRTPGSPGPVRKRGTPSSSGFESEPELTGIIMPSYVTGVTTTGKGPKKDGGWRPIPFSAPPVPPPPGDVTDTEDAPKVPPKPKSSKTTIMLSANQPGSTTSPQTSPTNGFPMSSSQQKDEPRPPASDIPNNNNNLRKDEDEFWPPPPPPDEMARSGGAPPPPKPKPKSGPTQGQAQPWVPGVGSMALDFGGPNNRPDASPNNNRKVIPPPRKFGFKPFKPYAPTADDPEIAAQSGLWSPSQSSPPRSFTSEAPPPPPTKNDGNMSAPVWTPTGGAPVKKEFKSVKPELTNRPKTSTVNQPMYSAPPQSSSQSPFTWAPNQQQQQQQHQQQQPQYQQPAPMTVDTLPDPSHILSPGYVSPRSPGQHAPLSQSQYPPPQSQYAPARGEGLGPSSPRPVPGSPSRPMPQTGQRHGTPPQTQTDYDGLPNGYGFLPSSAMSGSPSALRSDLIMMSSHPGSAPNPSSTNEKIITENLPAGALFQKQTVEGDKVHTDTFYPVQNVTRKTSSTQKHEAPSYEGIGPRDKDGMPTGLRQHVPEENRKNWYKEMFKSIHQQDKDDEDYLGENAPSQNVEDAWKAVSAENKAAEPARVIKNTPSYRMQPGRIHDFQPGHSALAEHEKMVQSQKDGPYNLGRRLSAPGSGYASDEEARKAYRNFVKSGELPTSYGLAFGAPPARRASATPKHPSADSRYDYLNQYQIPDRAKPEQKREYREPDASYNKSLPEYNPVPRSPTITDGRFDDFEFTPPVTVLAAKQEVPPQVERSPSLYAKVETPVPQSRKMTDDYFAPFDFNAAPSPGSGGVPSSPPTDSVPPSPGGRPPRVIRTPSLEHKITRASAIALYPFTAQTKKELSFHKGDTIYLTRDIDKNWYEGEHHGNRGIFPKSYVETVTSIEEARNLLLTAPSSEGKGRIRYKFKGETTNELSVNKGDIVELTRKVDDNWWEVRQGGRAGIVPVAYLDVIREPAQGMMSPQLSPGGGVPRSPLSPSGRAPVSPTPIPKSPSYSTQSSNPAPHPYSSPPPSSPTIRDRIGHSPHSGAGRGGKPSQNSGFQHRGYPEGERFSAVYSYQPSNDDELELMEGETVVVMEKCDDGWYVGFSEATGQFGTFPGNYVEKL